MIISQTGILSECRTLIEERKFAEVVRKLNDSISLPPNPERQALLGLAYFQLERYGLAAEAYEKAIKLNPTRPEWREMWELATHNQLAEVHVPVPEVYHFEREELLREPRIEAGVLPEPLPSAETGRFRQSWRLFVGNKLGDLSTRILEFLARNWGRIAGYRDEIWTNWYRRPLLLGILTLSYMRQKLNTDNLKTTYPKGVLIGFQRRGQTPPAGVTHFRTADGSWNNLEDPLEGAAGTRFPRNVANEAARPESGAQLMTPNPREVSLKLLTRKKEMKEIPFLNLLAASWIQFQTHDWVTHGENNLNDLLEIPLPADDPARKKFRQSSMLVPKTQPDPTRMPVGEESPVTFINEVTHWWDGSQIYGSDQATVDRLRSGVGGKLRLNADGTLPLDGKRIEETGFVRNWWVGLTMLHNLFAREHNAICDHLQAAYPDWEDNRLFNVARLINAAVMAKIHSVEWTPAVLANKTLDSALNTNWYGLLTHLFKKGTHRKTVTAIKVRNPELGGVVGNAINKYGAPFGLSEEFVEVYRLHPLLPESLFIQKINRNVVEKIPFVQTRQAGSAKLTGRVSMTDLFYSFGNQHPGQLVLNNYPRFMQELSIPFNPVFDLGAVDILRARERGVPRYNEFRRQLGLQPITRFEDLTDNAEEVQQLKEVYGSEPADVEKLDLMIGTLAESHRPDGFGFGETMFQIFILNATRRLQADRFYTTCYTEEYYTKEGLEWIDKTDLKAVLLRHYPKLARTGLANVKNAFEPWDTDAQLDPARHPLRAWDKTLREDPWTGDRHRI